LLYLKLKSVLYPVDTAITRDCDYIKMQWAITPQFRHVMLGRGNYFGLFAGGDALKRATVNFGFAVAYFDDHQFFSSFM